MICDAPSLCCKKGDNGCEGRCVRERWINDGYEDCNDGSDESKPLRSVDLLFRGVLVNILGIIGVAICFLLTVVFNALAGSGNSTFFNTVTGNISNKYELDTTPAGWTFSIWVGY